MKIGLHTWGTDGDARIFIGLAAGLAKKGHDVTLVVTSPEMKDYSAFAKAMKFKMIHAHESYRKWNENKNFAAQLNNSLIKQSNPMIELNSLFKDAFEPAVDEMYQAALKLCEENDAIIAHYFAYPVSFAAQKTNTPYAIIAYTPFMFSSRYKTPPGLPYIGRWANPFWWFLLKRLAGAIGARYLNKLRLREGFPKTKNFIDDAWESKTLTLVAASPQIFQAPPDWINNRQVCGYFNIHEKDEKWTMPKDLKKFLSEGEPPVYMTFGSMSAMSLQETTEILVNAAKIAGCRALVQSQWDKVSNIPELPNVYRMSTAPHQHIFPYCSAVVHHGGVGTTHSVSRAGLPSIVVEHFGDQLFWGTQLKNAGIGANVLHKRNVTAQKLARELRRVLDSPTIRQRAKEVGEAMRKETGVENGVALIEKYLSYGIKKPSKNTPEKTKKAGKPAVKKTAKKVVKSTAKKTTKSASKPAPKKTVKKVPKSAPKKAVKKTPKKSG